ncbi:hypothetical protein [Domibacillus epiphyticus]|uniref:Uncharacterized protein n=1 Tax=Domibacillus epiphyticus TaxID=1714355 RepID=A0A1V2A7T5_9BACI|nr:hypothetical protein [Domibacillus epiphyticus]OMP67007.1 hypothetical protein BTO28_08415 [Domibacillus epiphyticus]
MSNAKFKLYYVNGENEELESQYECNDEARSFLSKRLDSNRTWIYLCRKHINLKNVVHIEVIGEK